jgi:uroporphyrinogen decarboxylase
MTKKESFDNLCQGQLPTDRTLFRPILMHFAAVNANGNYGEFASDYNFLVNANLKALKDFDMDMVGLISDPYRETSAYGAQIEFIPDGVPRCKNTVIKTAEDIKTLERPDIYSCERTMDRIKAAELLSDKVNGDVPIIGWIEGPLAEACDLTGAQNFLELLMTDPESAHILIEKCSVMARDFAWAQIDAGCDIIGIGDAICSQIDPITYNTFVKKWHREIIGFIHGLGAKVKMHICGDINHLLPSLKDLEIDILDLDWQVDLDYAYEVMGSDVIRCGNINPVFIQDKSPTEIYNKCSEILFNEKGRRFILSAGCEITVNTPHENLHAMRNASIDVPPR